jgi:peptidoglycan/LPS O-acetylase OafA/YrhL
MRQNQSNYIPTLDGWRTIAVLMVIGYHGSPESIRWLSFFNYGHHGVNLFFGISGFLICSRLLDEKDRHGSLSLKNFYIRRAFRILPPAFIYILFLNFMASIAWMTQPNPIESLASCFFFRNFLPAELGVSYTGHYWSLAVEEHFYLFWPIFLILTGSKRALWMTPLLALGLEAWRNVDVSYGITHLNGFLYHQRTDRVLDGLLWGCVLALIIRQPGWRERLTRITITPLWLIYVLALVYVWITPLPFGLVFESQLTALVLIGTVLHPTTRFGRLLESTPMIWLGRLSYSIYLWQSALFVGRYQDGVDFQVWPINLFSLIVMAAASYYLIEKPCMAVGKRLTRRKQPDNVASPAAAIEPPQMAKNLPVEHG